MADLTVKQVSEKWGISERRIIKLCQDGRIGGAKKNGIAWMIPENTAKPLDKRSEISKIIEVQKRVMIANLNTEIGWNLMNLLEKQGYLIDGIDAKKAILKLPKMKSVRVFETDFEKRESLEKTMGQLAKYYDGFIFIDTDQTGEKFMENKEWLILKLAEKMDSDSSIVLVNNEENAKFKLEEKLAHHLKQRIGLSMNSLQMVFPVSNQGLVNYDTIAKDVYRLLTDFKNTTGISITTDGGYLAFDEMGRTEVLEKGIFYRALNEQLRRLAKDSHFWSASMMLEDEWTEEPLEMNFRKVNLEAANRCMNMERIFIFRKSEIQKFKKNKTMKVYMQSHIHTMFVDYHEILEKEPKLLEIVKDGWDGVDQEIVMVDLPSENEGRGYISRNKREVRKAYECFERLKVYAKELKEVLK